MKRHESETTAVLSQSIKRIDALGKVRGETPYPGDIDIDGQLWLRIKFSERAHARVISVDASRAEALSGVARVFTSRDVPVNEYGLVMKDQPVLCGPGGGKAGTDVVRLLYGHGGDGGGGDGRHRQAGA